MNILEKFGFKKNKQKEMEGLQQEADRIGIELKDLEVRQKNIEMGMEMQSGASGKAGIEDQQQLENITNQMKSLEQNLREVGRKKIELENRS